MSSSTQYDQIGQAYESLKQLPAAKLERDNLRDAVRPFLRPGDGATGATVLDLACGTGYYSRLLLEWGADRVVGVDISRGMIDAARQTADTSGQTLSFQVGDCTRPLSLDEKFDVVSGAWLLNYAASLLEMTAMFANVSTHLKPGGHFVGVTPHPAGDLDGFALAHSTDRARRDMRRYGVSVDYTAPLESGEGYSTRVTGHVSPVEVSFVNYHLRRDVYEAAARAGGMDGRLEWRPVDVPTTEDQSQADYGVPLEFWNGYSDRPHLGILVVEKL